MNDMKSKERLDFSDEHFQKLVVKKLTISLGLTALMVAGYFGYINSIAFHKEWLAQKINMHITLGLPLGLGVIVAAWVFTGIYVWWANTVHDKHAERLRVAFEEAAS